MSQPRPVASDDASRKVLVTGFPIFLARRLIRELVAGGDEVWILTRDKFHPEADQFAARLNAEFGAGTTQRVHCLVGDILCIDLGLTGDQVRALHDEIEEVHHMAAIQYLGLEGAKMRAVNIDGLREVLEFCLGIRRLRRLCHWSTAFVAGARSGTVHEHELMVGQRFRNGYEETKAAAEVLARHAMDKLPITVVRPPIIVGDAESGEIQRFDGPYLLMNAIVNAPANVAVPLPGRGRYPLHVVPADYAVRAGCYLARHPATESGTFHLVDPHPLTARQFFDAVADAAGRPRPQVFLPGGFARAVLKLPGLGRLARQERTFLEWFDTDIRFDNREAARLLDASGLTCPPVPAYVDVLVRFLREFTR